MSLKCMPLLFLNMGGEMVYILEQRLQAQNVSKEKSTRVLTDILYIMFNTKFLEELFRPQCMYDRRTMRSFFENLAHSSIMRLNKTSMDKLFDLMTMAYKYQLQLCVEPEQIVHITLNHLDCVRKILSDDETLGNLLDIAHQMVVDTYYKMPLWEQSLIRNCLLTFFQDARVKVSLFLREDKQNEDGRFILFPNSTSQLPCNTKRPGEMCYFRNGEPVRTEAFQPGDRVAEYKPNNPLANVQLAAEGRGTTLGVNMYNSLESIQVKGDGGVEKDDIPPPGDELKLLCALIATPNQDSKNGFQLSLFNDEYDEKQFKHANNHPSSNITRIDASKDKKSLTETLSGLKIGSQHAGRQSTKGEDLLDLLDEAAQKPTISNKNGAGGSSVKDGVKKHRSNSNKKI